MKELHHIAVGYTFLGGYELELNAFIIEIGSLTFAETMCHQQY